MGVLTNIDYTLEIDYPILNVKIFKSKLEEKISEEFLFLGRELVKVPRNETNPYSCVINGFKEKGNTNIFVPAVFLDIFNNNGNNSKTLKIGYRSSDIKENTRDKYINYICKLTRIAIDSALESQSR